MLIQIILTIFGIYTHVPQLQKWKYIPEAGGNFLFINMKIHVDVRIHVQ